MVKKQPDNEYAQYIPERRTVQILEILKDISDEHHPVKQSAIREAMSETGEATTGNAGTLANAIDEILLQINPVIYSEEDDDKYRIKYEGYKENRVLIKNEIKNRKKNDKKRGEEGNDTKNEMNNGAESTLSQRAPYITNLYYVHDFTYEDLDKLIQAVSFSAAIAPEDKEKLISKLVNTSSRYYSSPFYNRKKESLTFNPMGIYNRVQSSDSTGDEQLSLNLKLIQDAINKMQQITFRFNEYGEDGRLHERYPHTLSPYYIVVYHDMYYLIGGRAGKDKASHFRIDLITDVKPLVEEKGKEIKIEPMSHFKNLPKREQWDPEKYMSEHLYMAYDEPRAIRLKIPNDRYTILNDWFGKHYKKCKDICEKGYDIVEIKTSPNMIVHWAMQYAGIVEVMDEEIREQIKTEILNLQKKYL